MAGYVRLSVSCEPAEAPEALKASLDNASPERLRSRTRTYQSLKTAVQ